jgi:ankyrin repeat protein
MASLFYMTGQASPLFTLPLELLTQVADHLMPRDHNSLSQTCRYLTSALQNHLFQRCSLPGYHEAIVYGCTQPNKYVIRRALHYGFPPSIDDEVYNGTTSLALASYCGNPSAVAYLLRRHADVNQGGSYGRTPLAHAINGISSAFPTDDRLPPHAETLLRLLDAGANPRCRISAEFTGEHQLGNSVTVIVDAAVDDRLQAVYAERLIKRLVNKGASPNGLGCAEVTPLGWAVRRYQESEELLGFLLDKGADPNFGTQIGVECTALGEAIRLDNVEAMRRLICRGANTGLASNSPSCSPLWFAIQEASLGAAMTLLQYGADPNTVETARYRPALSAAVSGMHISKLYEHFIKHLLEYGADPNVPDASGYIMRYTPRQSTAPT